MTRMDVNLRWAARWSAAVWMLMLGAAASTSLWSTPTWAQDPPPAQDEDEGEADETEGDAAEEEEGAASDPADDDADEADDESDDVADEEPAEEEQPADDVGTSGQPEEDEAATPEQTEEDGQAQDSEEVDDAEGNASDDADEEENPKPKKADQGASQSRAGEPTPKTDNSNEARRKRLEDLRKRREASQKKREASENKPRSVKGKVRPMGGRKRAGAKKPKASPTPVRPAPKKLTGEPEIVVDIDLPEPTSGEPAEDREYQFSFENIEYAELLDAFARMSGLPMIGDPPVGKVTFKTTEVMDFDAALSRIRMLLFRHRDVYWMERTKDNVLHVLRMNEMSRGIPVEKIYPNVEAYYADNPADNELVMLLYRPEKGSVDDLMMIRDFLPDYVSMAPREGANTNQMTVFALVKDINKFLELKELFFAEQDPRIIKKIEIHNITPTAAIESLRQLMDLTGQAAPRPPRGKAAAPTSPGSEIKLLPDDDQMVLIVRALPSDIEEIERLLPYVDVDISSEYDPVIIALEHVTADKMMEQLRPMLDASTQTAKPAAASSARNKRGNKRPARRATPKTTSLTADKVTVLPNRRNNTLIVMGDEEGVARVRQYVAILDIQSIQERPTVVKIEHADGDELAGRLDGVMKQVRPQSQFSVVFDGANESLILVGSSLDLDLATEMIAEWDVATSEPTLHKYKLEHAQPSQVIAVLSQIESGTVAPKRPVARKNKKGRKPAPRRPNRTNAAGKFIADEANSILYIVCTDEEWESDYLPVIEQLEADNAGSQMQKHRIELAYADPTEFIASITALLDDGQGDFPQMAALADAVLILNPTPLQVAQIEALIPEFDVDPEASSDLVRRIFELEFVQPDQVRTVITTMLTSSSAPANVQPRRPKPKKGAPPRKTSRATAAVQDIKFVDLDGNRLMISAPQDKMERIEELIAQVDVEQDDEVEVRVYPFTAGVNVIEVANDLRQFLGGAAVPVRGRKGKVTPSGTLDGGITIIPQAAAHKILVSAPLDRFEEIEEYISILGADSESVEMVYEFLTCREDNADMVVSMMQPMLEAKLNNLLEQGVIPKPASGPKGPQARNLLTLQADPRGDRIVLAAPQIIVAEAKSLLALIDDREADETEARVIRWVTLDKTDSDEMVTLIAGMLSKRSASRPKPSRVAPRGKGRPAAVTPPRSGGDDSLDVVVNAAPGGQAVILSGIAKDVEEVEKWILDIEENAVASTKIVKLYDLGSADAERVADFVMAVVDRGGKQVRAPKKAPASDEDSFLDDFFSSEITRQGQDIYLRADTYSGTMLVAATPAKMREVDEIVFTFVGDPKTGEPGIDLAGKEEVLPYFLYDLVRGDAYDAASKLSSIIDAIWAYADKPHVNHVPFTSMLIVKGNPDRFDEVRALIAEYIDESAGGPVLASSVLSTSGTGMTAGSAARLLQGKLLGSGIEVEIVPATPDEPGELEEILLTNPCVLPAGLFHSLELAVAGVDDEPAVSEEAQASQEDPQPEEVEAKLDPAALIENLASAQSAEQGKKLRIVYDDKTGKMWLEGDSGVVEEAEDLIDLFKEEAKDIPSPPDIRIFRMKHVSVTKASDILEEMFNDKARRAQQARVLQQQRRQQQQERQRQQREAKKNQADKSQPQRPDQPEQPQQQTQQMPEYNITVYPNPRNRTLIIKAATEAYPAVISLLKKIDREPIAPLDYKIFTLESAIASEVEEQLKAMFGLGGSQASPRRGRTAGRARTGQAGGEDLIQMDMPSGSGSGAIAASEITITSNPGTNSIFAMAPGEAMELIERFIDDMENLGKPVFITKTVEMQYADVTQVVPQLDKFFKSTRSKPKDGGFDPTSINAPLFMPDPRTNSIIVRALEIDLPKILPMIEQWDDEVIGQEVRDFTLTHANATKLANTLQKLYGGKKTNSNSAKAVKIEGDAESNIIFVTAPPELMEEIAGRIASADTEAGQRATPRVLSVMLGKPTAIAKKIEEALGKGATKSIRITGDDGSKKLFVSAPDEMMPAIESLLAQLDKPPTSLDMKVYPLEHGHAKEVLTQLNQHAKQIGQQLKSAGIDMDAYSATADERSNSLVVMGGPLTFMMVDRLLRDLDLPARDPTQIVTSLYQLVNANAAEIARNINSIYRDEKKKQGVDPPKAEANPTSNTLIVRGTKRQIEEVYEQLIKPVEENAIVASADLKDERLNLQYAKADEVARDLTAVFNGRFTAINRAKLKNIKPSELTVSITPDVNGNALMVTASEANIAYIKEQLLAMDTEESGAKSATATRIHALTYAEPNSVANVINSAFRKQGRVAEKDRVQAVVEGATQSVVIIASSANQDKVAELISQMDVDSGQGEMREVYKVQDARASDLARIVTQTLNATRRRDRRGQLPVSVVANDSLNALIIAGSKTDYENILPLIKSLDQKPEEMTGLFPEVYVLKYADPGSTIGTIQSAFPRLSGATPEDTVRASYAWGTSSLVISASEENHVKVKALLDKIDQEGTMNRSVNKVDLEYANADDLAGKLGQIYSRSRRNRRDEQPMSFTADPGTNSLLVYSTDSELEELMPLLQSLDVKPAFEKQRQFKSFKLTYAESWGVKQMIDESFRPRGRNANPRDIVTTMADWGSNSIIVTASPERLEQVELLIAEVDKKDASGRGVHVVEIKHADAAGVNQALREIFVQGATGRRGQQTISISNPRGSDTLVIKANATEFQEIQDVIAQMDSSESEMGGAIQAVSLKYTDASETLEILSEYLRKPGGRGGRGAELAGDVRLSAIPSTNSLVISGEQDEIDHLVGIIEQIDVEVEDAQGSPKIIHLEYAQASEIEPALTRMFGEQRGGNRRTSRAGGATIQPVIIANDGSNSLIVRASAVDYNQIESLVEQMDTADSAVGSTMKIVTLKAGVNANDLASMIDDILDQNQRMQQQSRGGGGGGGRGRSQVQRVFVRADVRTNSLILSGPSSKFEEVETLVRDLEGRGPAGGVVSSVIKVNGNPEEIRQLLDQIISETKGDSSSGRRGSGNSNRRSSRRPRRR